MRRKRRVMRKRTFVARQREERQRGGGEIKRVLLVKRVLVPQYHTGYVRHRQFPNGHLDRLATPIFIFESCNRWCSIYKIFQSVCFARLHFVSRMTSSERVVLMIFGVILLVTSGSALRCWVCSSNVNTMCDDPMNTTDHSAAFHIRTCDQYPTGYGTSKPICRKIVKREYGERVVIRQCSTPNHDESTIVDGPCGNSMTQPGRDVIESCHICSTDLCNSATSASAMQLLYAGALMCFTYIFHSSKYCVF